MSITITQPGGILPDNNTFPLSATQTAALFQYIYAQTQTRLFGTTADQYHESGVAGLASGAFLTVIPAYALGGFIAYQQITICTLGGGTFKLSGSGTDFYHVVLPPNSVHVLTYDPIPMVQAHNPTSDVRIYNIGVALTDVLCTMRFSEFIG
jgi:hypothetical protein